MEHKDIKNSLDSELQVYSMNAKEIRSRKRDIFEKPKQYNFNQKKSIKHDA